MDRRPRSYGLVAVLCLGVTGGIAACAGGESGEISKSVSASPESDGTLGLGFGPEQFERIQAGTFQMGDMTGNGYGDERPVHTVTITEDFYIQKTEVTQAQWRAVMGENPSSFSNCGDTCPVERVSWNDIQEFIQALNAANPGANYRLPTEAEWEYAARAGTTGDYGGTGVLDEMGWYSGNSGSMTHPVAQKEPNHWGLYDMHGNVWEWVNDWYSSSYYSVSPPDDPQGPATGSGWGLGRAFSGRVLRGGSWFSSALNARSAFRRLLSSPSVLSGFDGFRLARTP